MLYSAVRIERSDKGGTEGQKVMRELIHYLSMYLVSLVSNSYFKMTCGRLRCPNLYGYV
jgi:hypothetical protein